MGNTVKVGRTGTKWREEESPFVLSSFCTRTPHGKCALGTVAFFKLKNDKKSHSRNQTDFRVCVSVWERDYTLAVYLAHLCNLVINVEPWALQLAILVPHSFALWQNMVSDITVQINNQWCTQKFNLDTLPKSNAILPLEYNTRRITYTSSPTMSISTYLIPTHMAVKCYTTIIFLLCTNNLVPMPTLFIGVGLRTRLMHAGFSMYRSFSCDVMKWSGRIFSG